MLLLIFLLYGIVIKYFCIILNLNVVYSLGFFVNNNVYLYFLLIFFIILFINCVINFCLWKLGCVIIDWIFVVFIFLLLINNGSENVVIFVIILFFCKNDKVLYVLF